MCDEIKEFPETYPEVKSLKELLRAIRDGETPFGNPHANIDAPTFGGEEPAATACIWSWDEENLLVGECADDLEIVTREEWFNN